MLPGHSKENLEILRTQDTYYVVGTPKTMLRKFERELTKTGWKEVQQDERKYFMLRWA